MANVNSTTLAGYVYHPEVRQTASGTSVVTFDLSFATYDYGNKETVWNYIKCTSFSKFVAKIFNDHGEAMNKQFVFVQGALHQEKWEDKQGNKKSRIALVLSQDGFDMGVANNSSQDSKPVAEPAAQTQEDDDIPF